MDHKMIECFKCGEEISFNKNILSKTGKQIPLWPDQRNTHSHDDRGNPIRGDLPEFTSAAGPTDQVGGQPQYQQQQQQRRVQPDYRGASNNRVLTNPPQYSQETTTGGLPGPTDKPTMLEVLVSQLSTNLSSLTKEVVDLRKVVNMIYEKVEYNTQVDTDKLIGQLQQIHDTISQFMGTQMKVASELYEDQQMRQKKAQEAAKAKREQEEQKNWNKSLKEKKEFEPEEPEGEEVVTEDDSDIPMDEQAL